MKSRRYTAPKAVNVPTSAVVECVWGLTSDSTDKEIFTVADLAHQHLAQRYHRALGRITDDAATDLARDSCGQMLDALEALFNRDARLATWMFHLVLGVDLTKESEEAILSDGLLHCVGELHELHANAIAGKTEGPERMFFAGVGRTPLDTVVHRLRYRYFELGDRAWPHDGTEVITPDVEAMTGRDAEAEVLRVRAILYSADVAMFGAMHLMVLLLPLRHLRNTLNAQRTECVGPQFTCDECGDPDPPGQVIASSPHLTNAPPSLLAAPLRGVCVGRLAA